MNSAEILIIEAGYKLLLRDNHPDAFPAKQRAEQDEVCKKLAVARDHLRDLLNNKTTQPTRNQPIPQAPIPAPRPIIDRDTVDYVIQMAQDYFLGKPARRTVRHPRPRRIR